LTTEHKNKQISKMKNILISMSLLLLITACSAGESSETNSNEVIQETVRMAALPTPDKFKNDLTVTLEAYFELKDALVQTDAILSREKAILLVAEMDSIELDGLSAEALMLWEVSGKDAKIATEALINATDVEVQRDYFIPLSNALIDMMKSYGPLDNAIYIQRCPMVRGGEADWLSKEEKILNPYFGSQMLTCGSVIEKV
jgi:hypothetical protein